MSRYADANYVVATPTITSHMLPGFGVLEAVFMSVHIKGICLILESCASSSRRLRIVIIMNGALESNVSRNMKNNHTFGVHEFRRGNASKPFQAFKLDFYGKCVKHSAIQHRHQVTTFRKRLLHLRHHGPAGLIP